MEVVVMRNVLIIGDSYVDADFFDANTRWFHIGKEPPTLELTACRRLCLAAKFDVEQYDKKLLEIFLFCNEIMFEFGRIDYVIANTEYSILCGAAVRDHYGISGRRLGDVVVFRNKFLMKSALAQQAEVATSRFVGGERLATKGMIAVSEVFTSSDYPLVLKAASQAGSRHVYVTQDAMELEQKMHELQVLGVEYLVEQFVDAPVIHIDGVCRQGELLFVCASRYLDDCYAWQHEKVAMSSVLIDEPSLQKAIVQFTQRTLSSLNARDLVFHLEAFLLSDQRLVFLEISSRPGGAAIVPCIKSIYGVDLLEENFRVEVEAPSVLSSSGFLGAHVSKSGGWIVLALPETSWCEVLSVQGAPPLGEHVTWRKIVAAGTRFNKEYFEDPAVGMFVVRHDSAEQVEVSIQQIKADFSIEVLRLEQSI
ncbi:ATP-grasp domain-containing protein [Pseudomonas batumici]|uniref:Carbamoylphosphate synthase large subunit n=1 Tax=Pseudomonas batumici TaxID=226910 RepID=A0A0C2IFD3_9PSED|nr:ATP-grasp domain-containing protein [Pseudomonas batumici]KIH83617.1 Carbamoylphosphate synthase large subunit [Pseudomonas batumici]